MSASIRMSLVAMSVLSFWVVFFGGVSQEAAGSESCDDPGEALSVVVVHGFHSNAAEMADLVSTLEATALDVAVEAFDYEAHSRSWVTREQIGPRLRQRLICLADASLEAGGLGRVAVVGHSMGGLATRQALSTDNGDGRGVLADEIALVATLGTPHEGSEFAGPAVSHRSSDLAWAVRHVYERTSDIVSSVPSVRNEAGRALAIGSQQLAALPDFPDGVPVLALAGEYVGQPRFLFYRAPEERLGDAVVTRASAWARSNQIDRIGGTDGIECHFDLPLELGPVSVAAAVWAEQHANPAFFDCFHTALPSAGRLTTTITSELAVAANQTPRERTQGIPVVVRSDGIVDAPVGEAALPWLIERLGPPDGDTGWVLVLEEWRERRLRWGWFTVAFSDIESPMQVATNFDLTAEPHPQVPLPEGFEPEPRWGDLIERDAEWFVFYDYWELASEGWIGTVDSSAEWDEEPRESDLVTSIATSGVFVVSD